MINRRFLFVLLAVSLFFCFGVFPAFSNPPAIVLVSPVGGEIWEVGTTHGIKWQVDDPTSNPCTLIYYSTNGGVNWTDVTVEVSPNKDTTGVYNWVIPNTPTSQARVGIRAYPGLTVSAESADFTISPARTLSIITPAVGDTWEVGTKNAITWTSTGLISSVDAYYSVDNGTTWATIETGTVNDGLYRWTVPNSTSLITTEARLKIADANDYKVYSLSATFEIKARGPITVLSPNGGETWYVGTDRTISWASDGTMARVKIYYSPDNGLTYPDLIANVSNSAPGGTYTWTIPDTPTTEAKVKVESISDTSVFDISNLKFNIVRIGSVSISGISPQQFNNGTSNYNVIISGTGFQNGLTLASSASPDVIVTLTTVELSTVVRARIDISANPSASAAIITLTNPDSGSATIAVSVVRTSTKQVIAVPEYSNGSSWNPDTEPVLRIQLNEPRPTSGRGQVVIAPPLGGFGGITFPIDFSALDKGQIEIRSDQFSGGISNGIHMFYLNGDAKAKVKIVVYRGN